MIDYKTVSEIFRPSPIKILLIGEAPPPSGKKYFYVPTKLSIRNIADDSSLPATIFNHYFGRKPEDEGEYKQFLMDLKHNGIYLIDIIDDPIKIRDRNQPKGINQSNLYYLKSQIPKLRDKLRCLEIVIKDENIIFLLARNKYRKELKDEFPTSKMITWKIFRMNVELL